MKKLMIVSILAAGILCGCDQVQSAGGLSSDMIPADADVVAVGLAKTPNEASTTYQKFQAVLPESLRDGAATPQHLAMFKKACPKGFQHLEKMGLTAPNAVKGILVATKMKKEEKVSIDATCYIEGTFDSAATIAATEYMLNELNQKIKDEDAMTLTWKASADRVDCTLRYEEEGTRKEIPMVLIPDAKGIAIRVGSYVQAVTPAPASSPYAAMFNTMKDRSFSMLIADVQSVLKKFDVSVEDMKENPTAAPYMGLRKIEWVAQELSDAYECVFTLTADSAANASEISNNLDGFLKMGKGFLAMGAMNQEMKPEEKAGLQVLTKILDLLTINATAENVRIRLAYTPEDMKSIIPALETLKAAEKNK